MRQNPSHRPVNQSTTENQIREVKGMICKLIDVPSKQDFDSKNQVLRSSLITTSLMWIGGHLSHPKSVSSILLSFESDTNPNVKPPHD